MALAERAMVVERTLQARRLADAEADFAKATAFSDPEEQFRHEVYLAWARRFPKEDKPDRPLCAYRLGDGFLGSLTSVDGIARRKVVDVTVEVLPDWPPTWTPASSTLCA